MRCSVQNCTNDTRRTRKIHGITFHLFPKEPELHNLWIEALGLSDWKPRERSVVCSEHFHENAFYQTNSSSRRIKNDAVPLPVTSDEDLDAPATLKVCRICLSMDVKMYNMLDNKLGLMYKKVTGIPIATDDELPQMLCWECAARLSSANTFRSKALRTQGLLMNKLADNSYITIRDVKSISRAHNQLNSTLCEKIYDVNDCDLHITYKESVKTETNNDNDDSDDHFLFDDNDDFNDLNIVEIEIKDEDNEILLEESQDFDSDNDTIPKKKRMKTGKKLKVKEKKREDRDDESPSTTIDKYKKSDVKRKKPTTGVDESLFTITKLTYEEQIAEVERRKEMTSYKSAPFKCTSCYRGFQCRDKYETHMIRHSEQSGAYECFICKTRCKTAEALRHHLTGQHTEQFSCKGCSFVSRTRCVAREHQKWHAGTKYECPHCFSEFEKPTTYKNHIRIKHACDFVCELCGYTFVNQKGIDFHKKRKHRLNDETVSIDGPYCNECEVRFASDEAYSRHLKLSSRHISDDDPTRMRNDSQSKGLKRNVRRPVIHPNSPTMAQNSDRSPVTCEQCGVQLRDLRQYVRHFRINHPDKNRTKYSVTAPFMCEQCGRIFQSMALLNDHMWVHTGEKNFKCDSCEKSFTNKKSLVLHMGVHNDTRRMYECPICGKNFSFYNNRRRHMLIHTGLKPYKCDTCGKCFTTPGEHRSHVEHVHLKKPWPKRIRTKGDDWKTQGLED